LKERSLFIQDEMQFLDGKLLLSPGLRYDSYSLTPSIDELFVSANPGVEVSEFDDSQVSKKLGIVYDLNEQYKVWMQYSEGFRIPPMDDVNIGFTNFAGGYTSLANPDLLPESVESYEIGLRGLGEYLTWSVSAFSNDYDNFIESLSVRGFNPMTRLLEFQATNIESVEITGVEGQLTWFVGDALNSSHDWQVRVSHSTQNSEDKATGAELDSILPAQTVFGIQYQDYDSPWHAELMLTNTQEANAISDDQSNPFFVAPSFTTLDLLGHIQISDNIRLNAGVFNITDKQYWLASEVRGRGLDEDLSRFTSAGRNFSVNVIAHF
jgi:hemoglobin/transferrin/lactoferrin receptor protein